MRFAQTSIIRVAFGVITVLTIGVFLGVAFAISRVANYDPYRRPIGVEERAKFRVRLDSGDVKVLLISHAEEIRLLAEHADAAARVEFIEFVRVDFSDEEFKQIQKCRNLETISVYDCRNTSALVASAKRLSKLKALKLDTIRMTPELWKNLEELSGLETLKLNMVVDDDAVNRLKKSLPNLNIDATAKSALK